MSSGSTSVALGDPIPWFSAETLTGAAIDIHVEAGRWVVLAFLGPAERPATRQALETLIEAAGPANDQHLVVYAILSSPPADPVPLIALSGPAFGFLCDYDGSLARRFGAADNPRTLVLDAMLNLVANIETAVPDADGMLRQVLHGLPTVDDATGVPLTAPVLLLPRIFEFELCSFLVELYDEQGGAESGFLLNRAGQTATVVDRRLKSRRDLVIGDPQLRDLLRDRLARRLVPAIERYFQFRPTRFDRTIVACYDAESGGHFSRHRDNVLPGARHRRFAVSINLNDEYDGCDLRFPEFGTRTYRPPVGGALVFSTGLLHQVMPIRSGRRLVFVPFLYGESDVAVRLDDNRLIAPGGVRYEARGDDLLFPLPVAAE